MWHPHHGNFTDFLIAKQLIFSLGMSGKLVFPNINTYWHFNDKIGQKYLLESIDAPLVTTYIFYNKTDALNWVNETKFPKVFKLRGGSGSTNVKLVATKHKAKGLILKAFGKGFSPFDKWGNLKERIRKFRAGKDSFRGILKGIRRLIVLPSVAKMLGREKGYIYFQDYIENNKFDIRVVVIDNKAFAIKRLVRENDFRASGSGNIVFKREELDDRCVKIAFDLSNRLHTQCLAYDFVIKENDTPLLLEISFGFTVSSYDSCEGYWDINMEWHPGKFNPCGWMVQMMI
jgi:glutathione synthase/RimK-type ligase-like ATP-grasp enzyme